MSKKRARADFQTDNEAAPSRGDWPASEAALSAARTFLRCCASARQPTLLVPDKDADGLCGAMIVYRTLIALGLPKDLIRAHFVAKGSNVHGEEERAKMEAYGARFVVVVDQGSRKSGPIVRGTAKDSGSVQTLILDHHWSDAFPEGAMVCAELTVRRFRSCSCLGIVGRGTPSHRDL